PRTSQRLARFRVIGVVGAGDDAAAPRGIRPYRGRPPRQVLEVDADIALIAFGLDGVLDEPGLVEDARPGMDAAVFQPPPDACRREYRLPYRVACLGED